MKKKLRASPGAFFCSVKHHPPHAALLPADEAPQAGRNARKKRGARRPPVPLRHRLWAFFGRGSPQGVQQPLYFSKKATTFISRTSFKISSSSNHQESPRYFLLPMYAQRASSASTHTGQTSQ